MGLTAQSSWIGTLKNDKILPKNDCDFVVALAGNPNTGKSTVFNSLTGLRQHTGNWPGKTVSNARGKFSHQDKDFLLVDLPGTYSLFSNSVEEEIARDFICFAKPQVTVVVTDATCLERNLNLVLQVLEMTKNVVVCVNLIDEARRKKIKVNTDKLSDILGVPVVGTNARDGEGLNKLKQAIFDMALGKIETEPLKVKYDEHIEKAINELQPYLSDVKEFDKRWFSLRFIEDEKEILNTIISHIDKEKLDRDDFRQKLFKVRSNLNNKYDGIYRVQDKIVSSIVKKAEKIARDVVVIKDKKYNKFDRKLDDILTSKKYGVPVMLALLGVVFWITIIGADYPSEMLAKMFFTIEGKLTNLFTHWGVPEVVHDIVVLGVYRTLGWVIAVMLPPMAIFFPMFTLLEDLGYLPRVAFNLDNFFKKACAHGKQALTMCMGFGCNAAGVIGCRIIDSPRERLIATITNNFVPCNGRFPILIAISTIFIAGNMGRFKSIVAAISLLFAIVLSVIVTLIVSKFLSKTLLKGIPSSFTLELPPYRKPQVGRIIVRSIFDRTLYVLARAIVVAAPAGLLIWFMANVTVGNVSVLDKCASFLDPFGRLIGLDGYILMAFILGLPANEIVIPVLIMGYMSKGALLELDSFTALGSLLEARGWNIVTAICMMIMTLNHFPCGTTLLTIQKETQSFKWTFLSFLIPTVVGIILCFVVAQMARILGIV